MEVKQISTILNDTIVPETIGESATVNEDLSNIIDVGKQITSSTAFNDNFDNLFKKLIDRIGKTVFVDRPYSSKAPKILKDSWEYGSALQKIRCDLPKADDSKEWTLATLANGQTVDPFVINKPEISVKYYNNKTTFTIPITIGKKQVKEAFVSAEEMNKLFSMITTRIYTAQTLNTDAMIQRTINNLIANKIHSKKNVINLLTEYNTAKGASLKAADALYDSDFLKFASEKIALYKQYIQQASMLYNNDGYVTFTPSEAQRLVVLSEFAKAMEFYSYADTYHNEYIKMNGYTEIPFWQASGTDNSFAEHAKINISAVDMDGKSFNVEQGGILGVLFDENAAAVCCEDYETEAIFNPRGKYTNYFYSYDCSYFNDLAENCIVFIIADPADPAA